MTSELPKMIFDVSKTKIKRIYESKLLAEIQQPALDCSKIEEIYDGNLKFLPEHSDRPYLYSSLVTSIDGKIAFSDIAEGPLIARKNKYDPDGATADWWILNLLRASADGIIVGAGTLQAEADFTGHIFDQDLEDARIKQGKMPIPWNIISSINGLDIPFDHFIFKEKLIPLMISTSAKGLEIIKQKIQSECIILGPFTNKQMVKREEIDIQKEKDKIIIIATGDEQPDSEIAMYVLKALGLHRILVETPTYMHILLSLGLIDELFFNYSCLYIGGEALSIGKFGKEFTSIHHPHTAMLSIHCHSDHFFYFRHKLIYG